MTETSKRILLTGATGFIGRHVLNSLLDAGYEVCAICNARTLEPRKNLKIANIDLFDYGWLKEFMEEEKFENLIHLAWYLGDKFSNSDKNLDWIVASLELLKNFKKNNGKKVLFAGSMSEYDYSYGYCREYDTPLMNTSLYGRSKAALYLAASSYAKFQNLDFKWARIFNTYGSYERKSRLMPSVICSILNNEPAKLSKCEKTQDYLYVEDVADALLALFESDVQGAVNISSGTPVALKEIVNKINSMMGGKGQLEFGSIPANFEEPFIIGSNDRLKNEVGWTPKHTLEEGLSKTINWWKENNV